MSRRGQEAVDLQVPLPHATAAWLQQHGRRADNLGLYLDRFVQRDRNDRWQLRGNGRVQALDKFVDAHTAPAVQEALERRLDGVIELGLEAPRNESLASGAPLLLRLRGKLLGKLLVDYGRKGTNEAGLSFHPLYGAPRIPGSALKGATRTQAELEGWPPEKLLRIFGSASNGDPAEPAESSQSGNVCFLEALPENGRFSLVLDTLTPHHKRWNSGDLAIPLETESPEPFSFLAVARANFVFDLMTLPLGPAAQRRSAAQRQALEQDLRDTMQVLVNALSEAGVGAKTAAGYGWFDFGATGRSG